MRRRLLALTVALVVVLPLSVVAARWQWSRHLERDARNAQIMAAREAAVEPFPGPLGDGYDDSDRYRRLEVRGQWLPTEQLLVRKSVVDGNVGFSVMTPFISEEGVRLYVVRGWSETDVVAPAEGSGTIEVRIEPVLPNGTMRPTDLPVGQINWLDPRALSAGRPHADAVFELVAPADPALVPIPVPELSAGPHVSYTIQWLLIGLTAIIVYFRVVRRELQESREN